MIRPTLKIILFLELLVLYPGTSNVLQRNECKIMLKAIRLFVSQE
jgi:hypothetical protein